jgi:hypothetical protein
MTDDIELCPACGALPCDWVDNPHSRPAPSRGDDDADGWLAPYRSMDASGSPEAAKVVGETWMQEIINRERLVEPEALTIERSADFHVLYRATKMVALYCTFRDPMNFTVLMRWLASPAPRDTSVEAASKVEVKCIAVALNLLADLIEDGNDHNFPDLSAAEIRALSTKVSC